ncbi:MAG TPA: hypothetical protein ENN80_13865, partial [Candidatus Hydrogenedentes bacterium]|nr:hypothetical protein [Candidatus Hydrogenedentota bacterium]
FLYLLLDRFLRAAFTFALSLGGAVAFGTLIIGLFRYKRDVLMGHAMNLSQKSAVGGVALGAGLAVAVLAAVVLLTLRGNRIKGVLAGAGSYVLLLLVGAVLSSTLPVESEPAIAFEPQVQSQGPNIILVAVDALRADALTLYDANAEAKTPRVDAFRQDGVLFPNSFVQSTWTKPSFATLFSGLYPEAHTATTKVSALPKDIDTVAEILYSGGYYTKGFSNNPNIMSVFDFDQGFVDYTDLKPDVYYFGATYSASKLSLYEVLRKGKQRISAKFSNKLVVSEFYQPAEDVTREALDWLDGDPVPQGVPFYLFLHYMEPHDPFMVAGPPGSSVRTPRVGYARARMEHPDPKLAEAMRQAYNDDIEYMDIHIGALFDGLKERGLYDNSLIVFTSDHGEEFYDHKGWWHGQTLYDELMLVPLVIKLPGNARAGEQNPYFARQVDIPATFLHSAGLEQPEAMRGKPLFAEDNTDANTDTSFVYAEVDFEGNDLQAVRTYDAKIIRANEDSTRGFDTVEFYDLAHDPAEQNNLAGENHPRAEEQRSLDETLEEMKKSIREGAPEPSHGGAGQRDVQSQLEALGYL